MMLARILNETFLMLATLYILIIASALLSTRPVLVVALGTVANGTVYYSSTRSPVFKSGVIDEKGAAYGVFNDTFLTTGWSILDIKAGYGSGEGHDFNSMYAAGYLEGVLTHSQIYDHYQNLKAFFFDNVSDDVKTAVKNFLLHQMRWVDSMYPSHDHDPHIHAASLIVAQLKGLIAGYHAAAPAQKALDKFAFFVMNGAGDLGDLLQVVNRDGRPNFNRMTPRELKDYVLKSSHCSALIKVTGAFENIFFSHSTWAGYQMTNRIFKYYDFNIKGAASSQVSFSSYPGEYVNLDLFSCQEKHRTFLPPPPELCLLYSGGTEVLRFSRGGENSLDGFTCVYSHKESNLFDIFPFNGVIRSEYAANYFEMSIKGFLESIDDFYMMGNGLVMLQTTNGIFNTSLYDTVTPKSLPAWVRVRAANMMSRDSTEWGPWIEKYNSGTYNNQYMILDLNKVKLNEKIEDNALWVVEQIPTVVEYADQTAELRLGYWPSYNVPYFEKIYNMSGYPNIVKKEGLDNSYELAPRAKIFRRDAAKVTDMHSMKHIMRYNEYQTDPYTEGNSCDTICCRGDLLSEGAMPNGCYDTKVADIHMAKERLAWVINGPSRSDNLKPFSWLAFKNTSHVGLPDVYNFDFELMRPIL